MGNVLRLAIVDPDDSKREKLKSMLLGMDMIWLEAECSRYEFFSDVVAQTGPDIGLVAIDSDPEKGLDLVGRLTETSPDCAVLVVSSSNDGDLILRVLRAGAKEYLNEPVRIEDLLAALGRISERRPGHGDKKPRGSQVIAVAGAIGGVGTTSVAVNLGCSLAANPENSVALIDLDLCLGDA
ncbi:MAG: response regulator, partial [Thermoguttaceae bacterium]